MLTTLAILGCYLLCFVTLAVVVSRPVRLKELRRAFEALEEEFEEQRESVRSTLGRISRLRRDKLSEALPADSPEALDTSVPALASGSGAFPRLNARQNALQAGILARRNKVVN